MNKYKLHTLINSAKSILEDDNGKSDDLKKIFQIIANELQDPFASSIDEFLAEKESKKESGGDSDIPVDDTQETDDVQTPNSDHPQDEAVDTLKEEAIDYEAPIEQVHPQDEAIDSLKEEAFDYKDPTEKEHPQDEAVETLKEEAVDYENPVEKDHPQDELKDKVVDEVSNNDDDEKKEKESDEENDVDLEKEKHIESKLKQIADDLDSRGYSKIAKKFIKAASVGIIETLNNLLMQEFLIQDILESYAYLFDVSNISQIAKYRQKDNVRILFLQKQIVFLGGRPTNQRYAIPSVNPLTQATVIDLVKNAISKVIRNYGVVISSIEKDENYLTLKTMLQKIVKIYEATIE